MAPPSENILHIREQKRAELQDLQTLREGQEVIEQQKLELLKTHTN